MGQPRKYDVLIAGAGLAGLTAALGCANAGLKVGLIAPGLRADRDHPSQDGRTTALLDQSIGYLDSLGIWSAASAHAAPLQIMRIIDDTGRLFRSPQLDFRAQEIGLDQFGFNIENKVLANLLLSRLKSSPLVEPIDAALRDIALTGQAVRLETAAGDRLEADFLIGAEGRTSPTRTFLGGESQSWSYPQSALVANFTHSVSHGNVSTEFHTPKGPFTTVPLGDNQSSLVWVDTPSIVEEALTRPAPELNLAIERKMHSILGKVELRSAPQTFPLSAMVAKRFGTERVAAIGEAAHVIPPIGAQGFNLGIRDVQSVVRLLTHTNRQDWGTLGDRFHNDRAIDIQTRIRSVDLLNQSLLSDFLPVQMVRSTGLSALGQIGPLRRFMMRQGISGAGIPKPPVWRADP